MYFIVDVCVCVLVCIAEFGAAFTIVRSVSFQTDPKKHLPKIRFMCVCVCVGISKLLYLHLDRPGPQTFSLSTLTFFSQPTLE